jgi:hypothetical protein
MYAVADMSATSVVLNYYGNGYSTVIEVQYCYSNAVFKNRMSINDCVIRPSDAYTGDTRAIIYTSDALVVTFNNVAFMKSLSGVFPTSVMFYFHYNTYTYVCNKVFNSCSFYFDFGYPITLGACTLDKCVTNYGAISHPSITNKIETNCLYNQTFGNEMLLTTADNSLYGVYSGSKSWSDAKIIILANDGKYYTYYNGALKETTLEYHKAFSIGYMEFVNNLKDLSPFKIILITSKEYSTFNLPINNHSFILINVSNYSYKNIQMNGKHKMLFSNDLKTWYNYYDSKNYNKLVTDKVDDYFLRDYVMKNCKYIDMIEERYNFIYLHLEDGEVFDGFTEDIIVPFKKVDLKVDMKCGSGSKATVIVPEHVTSIVIKKLTYGKAKLVKNTMEVF